MVEDAYARTRANALRVRLLHGTRRQFAIRQQDPMHVSRASALCATIAFFTNVSVANAFDFPEHAHISHDAIQVALASNTEARDVLKEISGTLHGANLCEPDRLFEEAPIGCFELGDLPALSGDHAASPLLLKWRWFNDCSEPHDAEGAVELIWHIAVGLSGSEQSPEHVLLRPPRVPQMLELIRRLAPTYWPLTTPPNDSDFLGVDDAYVALSERGRPHFRPALSAPSLALATERTGKKPMDQAYAWYADLHAGALLFARHSYGLPHADRQKFFRGLATLMEMTALHYLEDAVAPGHMVPERWMNNGSRMATHNLYNVAGIVAKPSPELCTFVLNETRRPLLASLADSCSPTVQNVRLYGDHYLSSKPRGVSTPTHDWAVAVAAKSIVEIVDAATKPSDLPVNNKDVENCDAPLTGSNYTWESGTGGACGKGSDNPGSADQRVYRCAYRWWETSVYGDKTKHIALNQAPMAATALGMVPVPLANDVEVKGDDMAPMTQDVAANRKQTRDVYPTVHYYSDGGLDAQPLISFPLHARPVAVGATVGGRLVVPRVVAPVQIGAGFSFLGTPKENELSSVDLVLDARFIIAKPLFVVGLFRAGFAREHSDALHIRAGGAGGLGGIIHSWNSVEWSVFGLIGGAGVDGPTIQVGTGFSVQ